MKNFVNILRWIFCLPAAIIGGTLASRLILFLFTPFKSHTFADGGISLLFDITFILGFVYSFSLIVPDYKKITTFSIACLVVILHLLIWTSSLLSTISMFFIDSTLSTGSHFPMRSFLLDIVHISFLFLFCSYLLIKIWKAKEPFRSLLDIFKK